MTQFVEKSFTNWTTWDQFEEFYKLLFYKLDVSRPAASWDSICSHLAKRDREAVVVGAGPRDGEGERAYTVYDPILGGEKYLKLFKRF